MPSAAENKGKCRYSECAGYAVACLVALALGAELSGCGPLMADSRVGSSGATVNGDNFELQQARAINKRQAEKIQQLADQLRRAHAHSESDALSAASGGQPEARANQASAQASAVESGEGGAGASAAANGQLQAAAGSQGEGLQDDTSDKPSGRPFFTRCRSAKYPTFQGWKCGDADACYGDPKSINNCQALHNLCLLQPSECECAPGDIPTGATMKDCSGIVRTSKNIKPAFLCKSERKTSHACSHHGHTQTLAGALRQTLGDRGTLLLIGDSTLRYQFRMLCNCIAQETCHVSTIRAGGHKPVFFCGTGGPNAPTGAKRSKGVLVILEESAGGAYHAPYSLKENHVGMSIARLNELVDLKQRGRLVVFSNFGALHLFNIYTIGGWVENPGRTVKKAGTDFQGFMRAREWFERDLAGWTAAGASAFLVMTPHWVCVDHLPGGMRSHVRPELNLTRYHTNIRACVEFVGRQSLEPTWSHGGAKTDRQREWLCNRSQLSESPREPGGSPYLREVWAGAVNDQLVKGANNVAYVDAYNITRDAGCNASVDGRHVHDAVVMKELWELFKVLRGQRGLVDPT